jgi:predicted membrane chloride channel (bestrophin family)
LEQDVNATKSHGVSFPQAFIGQVSFLVTLLISFRITNAFQQYEQGLRALSQLLAMSRQLLAQVRQCIQGLLSSAARQWHSS